MVSWFRAHTNANGSAEPTTSDDCTPVPYQTAKVGRYSCAEVVWCKSPLATGGKNVKPKADETNAVSRLGAPTEKTTSGLSAPSAAGRSSSVCISVSRPSFTKS